MVTRARIWPGDEDERHGTANGYRNLQCRCADCTSAWSTYFRALADKPRELPAGDDRHGTTSGYQYWHCKCDSCRAGHAQRKRDATARRRAGS